MQWLLQLLRLIPASDLERCIGLDLEVLLCMAYRTDFGWLTSAPIPLPDAVAASQHAGQFEGFSVEFDLLDLLLAAGSRRRMGFGVGLGPMGAERTPCASAATPWPEGCRRTLGASTPVRFGREFSHQVEEEAESFAVDGRGVELEASGKQSASMLASSCLPLAFCRLSRSVSFLVC